MATVLTQWLVLGRKKRKHIKNNRGIEWKEKKRAHSIGWRKRRRSGNK